MKKAIGIMAPVIAAALVCCSGCSKGNIFSWTHTPGSSSDVKALQADANAALRDKDYGKALEYYQRIIDGDPANAEAIYGEAAAELGRAGIDIATLVSNLVLNNSGSVSTQRLAPAIASCAHVPSQPGNILPSAILNNLAAIRTAVENVLRPDGLPRIVEGRANGSIAPDNPDVNLNLAFCYILHAALILNELVEFDTEYNASVRDDVSNEQLQGVANTAANDLVGAYLCIKRVMAALHLTDSGALADINNDVKRLFEDYKRDINDGPYEVTITAVIPE